ncbi:hypothetical protein [Pseudorhodoplanes sp.]|uniref:hypothetical protein n=1 Tax=Pseudorhodoplanes sp. TaxID=1934341 RepID=UPI003D0AD47B
MISWLLRIILVPAGVIAGWFVGKDQPNFGLVQSIIALFVIVFIVAVLALTRGDAKRTE